MKIVIDNKSLELKQANTFLKKLKGLMFKKNINYAIQFRCNGIHTFFMKEAIDVLLCDKNNNVIKIYKSLKKNRIILPKNNVYYTNELPKNTIKNNIKKIKITC